MPWLLLACFLWGPSFYLVPELLQDPGFSPYGLAAFRMATAAVLFLPAFRKQQISKAIPFMALGGVQYGAMYLTLFLSYRFMAGYEVALATIFTPFYVILIHHLLRRTRPSAPVLVAVLLAILGAGIVRYARPNPTSDFWIGFALMQLCNLCFATGQVFYRKRTPNQNRSQHIRNFSWCYLGAFVVAALGWSLLASPPSDLSLLTSLTPRTTAILLWLGLVPSGIAFFAFNYGASTVTPAVLAVMNNLKIPIAVLVVLLIFQQATAISNWPRFILGSGLMLGALWLPKEGHFSKRT